ncbi:MAG: prephenate dehydratase [Clostridiales bacterium]|jgi:prephenate dehydratase|nr:prephenate dehydratase [Clostridiales bacterium]
MPDKTDIAYFGPAGTFTHQAALYYNGNANMKPYHTIDDLLEAVNLGHASLGVVPLENSTEGVINATLDNLIFETDLFIKAELSLKISQNLFVRDENSKKEIKKILSHPQGLAQCRKFLRQYYPNAEYVPAASTSEAVKTAAESAEAVAAIGNTLAGLIYNLRPVKENIQDFAENTTTFVVVTKENTAPPKAGFKTSIALSLKDKPGELHKMLDIFAVWDINMTKILSRPARGKPGEYVFFIDFGGFEDALYVNDALKMIRRKAGFLKELGSYPVIVAK